MLVPLNQACIILSLNGYDYGEVGGVGCDYDDGDGDDDIGDYDDDLMMMIMIMIMLMMVFLVFEIISPSGILCFGS